MLRDSLYWVQAMAGNPEPDGLKEKWTNIGVQIYIYIYTDICMYVCTYVRMYVCTYVCMYVCTYVRMYVCTYVRMYVCRFGAVCTFYISLEPKTRSTWLFGVRVFYTYSWTLSQNVPPRPNVWVSSRSRQTPQPKGVPGLLRVRNRKGQWSQNLSPSFNSYSPRKPI